ncbi:MAG: hypothetical protein U0132_12515 [Gemmatimonadaceae bacterium]
MPDVIDRHAPLDPRLVSQRSAAEAALARAPYDPEAHDAYARVLVACDQLDLAADAWEAARTLAPGHVGAIKGLGFLAFRRGDLLAAERLLVDACARAPRDEGARAALMRVQAAAGRAPAQAPAPTSVTVSNEPSAASPEEGPGEAELPALLTDHDGLVLAGTLGGVAGAARRASVACDVSVLARALEQASLHLGVGRWRSCLIESDQQAVAVSAPMPQMLLMTVDAGEGASGRVLAAIPAQAARVRLRMGGAL